MQYMLVCAHKCVEVRGWRSEVGVRSVLSLYLTFWNRVSRWSRSSLIKQDNLAREFQESPYLCLPVLGLQINTTATPTFSRRGWEAKYSPHACTANTKQTEPIPQPSAFCLYSTMTWKYSKITLTWTCTTLQIYPNNWAVSCTQWILCCVNYISTWKREAEDVVQW